MVFSATIFLFFFLPTTIAVYFVLPKRLRNLYLLGASLLFYTWGSGGLVVLLAVSTAVDYVAGWVIARGRDLGRKRLAAIGLIVSVIVNLSMLGYFKYANFVVEQINAIAAHFGLGPIAWTSVVLPIGISFFTFQSMSYSIDVFTGRAERIRSLLDFALYVSLFPQLVAGPIVRFHEIADELNQRVHTWDRFSIGMQRFAWGLSKKVLVADSAAVIADAAFALDQGTISTPTAWIGVLAYTVQIYFDFSGYSDMAIGLGTVFGFTFPENFKRPYSSVSITDFWRRWHITLSNWFRDYLYIPLGGSRGSQKRTVANLWIVFLATGVWHGAAWTFIIWGAYHGTLLSLERVTGQRPLGPEATRTPILRRVLVLFAVMVGWVLFRSPTVSHAADYVLSMLHAGSGSLGIDASTSAYLGVAVGALVLIASRSPLGPRIGGFESRLTNTVMSVALIGVLLPLSLVRVLSGSFSPFIYFQF